jgi:hypothetical protein
MTDIESATGMPASFRMEGFTKTMYAIVRNAVFHLYPNRRRISHVDRLVLFKAPDSMQPGGMALLCGDV